MGKICKFQLVGFRFTIYGRFIYEDLASKLSFFLTFYFIFGQNADVEPDRTVSYTNDETHMALLFVCDR